MVIPVKTTAGEYDIVLERDSLENVGKILDLNRKVLVVTDSGVPAQYAQTVASRCRNGHIFTIPQGEGSKNFDTYKAVLEKLVELDFTRTDCVAAVGGGVVGDLSGFAAATFMRGIDFYNIPTTVLSQVDSSIGGKVAIDFCGYKNIVGAFYPPKKVVIDPNTLKTLPKRQIMNGLAESVKMSLTCDGELFELFEKGNVSENMDKIIEASLRIKKYVVETDEKEAGLRKILNFGHTLAHAIESQNGMQELYHGECVALGMLPMCSQEVRGRLTAVLEKLELPVKFHYDPEKICEAVKHDKKASGEEITVIFVQKAGSYEMRKMKLSEFEEQIRKAANL